jgi:hypothetical protein
MKATLLAITGIVLAYLLGICQARPPTPPSNKPIVNQEVLRAHQKLYPQQVTITPGVNRIDEIEKLGRPTWKWGRWVK